jgi:hypothetical protein
MISKSCLAILTVCGTLLIVATPTATQAAEPAAQHASARDTKVVCRRAKKSGSETREGECMTKAQWRAARGAELVCRWGKAPGSDVKEQFCATVAEWRAYDARAWASGAPRRPPAIPVDLALRIPSLGGGGTSPSVPGNSNFGGTVASQADFQR